jgi:hypothetical protein
MVTMSESIATLAAALVKAQGQMKPAIKDATNPHFRSTYADLASVIEASRKPLADNGLAISQHIDLEADGAGGGIVGVTTLLLHASGEWLQSRAAAVVVKRDPQSIGSAVTYLRRYGWQAVIGLAAEDDDGEAATDRREPQLRVASKPDATTTTGATSAGISTASGPPYLSEAQRRNLEGIAAKNGHTHEGFKNWLAVNHGIESTTEIPVSLFATCAKRLADKTPLTEVA